MLDSSYKIPAIVLDANIRSQEGIIQSLGKHNVPVVAISSLHDCPAFHSKYVVESYISPRIEAEGDQYINFLITLPIKGVLIYSDDVNTVFLSRYQEKLIRAGFLVNMPAPDNLEKVFDKWTCSQVSNELGINFPKTSLVQSIIDAERVWDEFNKPVILKGTRLAGGEYEKIDSLDKLRGALETLKQKTESEDYRARNSKIILQEFLEYKMTDIWCCETVYNQNSIPMGHFTIRKIRPSFMGNGEFGSRMFAGEYIYSKELIEMTDKLLLSMQWKGFAHLDFVYQPRDKRFYLLEVNPRLPGFSFYPSAAGYKMALLYYLDLIGETPRNVSDKYPISVYFETFRSPGDVTANLYYMMKGWIRVWPYILSYLRLLQPGIIKVIEPIRLDDMGFTMRSVWNDFRNYLNWIVKGLKKRLLSIG